MNAPSLHSPDLESLVKLFPPASAATSPDFEYVPATQIPDPYHGLLVHEHHMTVTVEAFHRDLVDVKIMDQKANKNWYARKILLALQGSGRVVQFGIMRIHFDHCSPEVRQEILAGKTPLGRILIEHDVLRRIEPKAYLRVVPGTAMMTWFGLDQPLPTYGRLALIHCNDHPAVELLEVVAPELAT